MLGIQHQCIKIIVLCCDHIMDHDGQENNGCDPGNERYLIIKPEIGKPFLRSHILCFFLLLPDLIPYTCVLFLLFLFTKHINSSVFLAILKEVY